MRFSARPYCYRGKIMPEITESFLHDQLVARRRKLESTANTPGLQDGIMELLNQVDSALARMEAGTYGLCEVCHDTVEKDRLLADPLVRLCLDHLNADQRRALEQDLELAGQLQRGLLPSTNLQFGGWAVSYHYRPLGLVSGDYCDLVMRENGSANLFFALGDVSGKGVAASLLMSQLHAIFRTLTATDLPAQALVERAGRIFCEATMSPFLPPSSVDGRIHWVELSCATPDIAPRWWANKARSHACKPAASRLACSATAATPRTPCDSLPERPCFCTRMGSPKPALEPMRSMARHA